MFLAVGFGKSVRNYKKGDFKAGVHAKDRKSILESGLSR